MSRETGSRKDKGKASLCSDGNTFEAEMNSTNLSTVTELRKVEIIFFLLHCLFFIFNCTRLLNGVWKGRISLSQRVLLLQDFEHTGNVCVISVCVLHWKWLKLFFKLHGWILSEPAMSGAVLRARAWSREAACVFFLSIVIFLAVLHRSSAAHKCKREWRRQK